MYPGVPTSIGTNYKLPRPSSARLQSPARHPGMNLSVLQPHVSSATRIQPVKRPPDSTGSSYFLGRAVTALSS